MGKNITSKIQNYTVCLYREKFYAPVPIGTGLLFSLYNNYYLVSAHHVFDMEEEQIQIENDPDEEGILHDDLDGIMARSHNVFFYINHFMKGLVWSCKYDEEYKHAIFNDDTEWCVCELTDKMVEYFRAIGKEFYNVLNLEGLPLDRNVPILMSGFPKYAQKEHKEEYRSFLTTLIDSKVSSMSLFRIHFNNSNAYNCEQNAYIKLPKIDGIAGMSGGGLWFNKNGKIIPIGIILKQDQENNFIEAYRLDSIMAEYLRPVKHKKDKKTNSN